MYLKQAVVVCIGHHLKYEFTSEEIMWIDRFVTAVFVFCNGIYSFQFS
jgi:hypothetical protein